MFGKCQITEAEFDCLLNTGPEEKRLFFFCFFFDVVLITVTDEETS